MKYNTKKKDFIIEDKDIDKYKLIRDFQGWEKTIQAIAIDAILTFYEASAGSNQKGAQNE